jgi:hypothetical protein
MSPAEHASCAPVTCASPILTSSLPLLWPSRCRTRCAAAGEHDGRAVGGVRNAPFAPAYARLSQVRGLGSESSRVITESVRPLASVGRAPAQSGKEPAVKKRRIILGGVAAASVFATATCMAAPAFAANASTMAISAPGSAARPADSPPTLPPAPVPVPALPVPVPDGLLAGLVALLESVLGPLPLLGSLPLPVGGPAASSQSGLTGNLNGPSVSAALGSAPGAVTATPAPLPASGQSAGTQPAVTVVPSSAPSPSVAPTATDPPSPTAPASPGTGTSAPSPSTGAPGSGISTPAPATTPPTTGTAASPTGAAGPAPGTTQAPHQQAGTRLPAASFLADGRRGPAPARAGPRRGRGGPARAAEGCDRQLIPACP